MREILKIKAALFAILLPALLVSCPPSRQQQQPSKPPPREVKQKKELKELRDAFEKGDYGTARAEAEEFLSDYPSSGFGPEAQYILAMSYMRGGLESEALRELEKLVKNYPESGFASRGAETLRSLEARRLQHITATHRKKESASAEWAGKMQDLSEQMRITAARERVYVVVDLMHDLVMLKMGDATLYAFPAATGKGWSYLRTTGKKHRFATPIGKHEVISKKKNPKWVRPDWYWLERGEEVPEGMTKSERSLRGTLGKYKVNIGRAIYFHGHWGVVRPGKYTHGCIRLNSGDLKIFYELVKVGTPVYIF